MRDFSDMVKVLNKQGEKSIDYSIPSTFMFGTVLSTNPLKINVEQRMTLDKHSLILTRNVTNYNVSMMIDDERKTYRIYNALSVGEKVVLLRKQGGQKFIVIDRVIT